MKREVVNRLKRMKQRILATRRRLVRHLHSHVRLNCNTHTHTNLLSGGTVTQCVYEDAQTQHRKTTQWKAIFCISPHFWAICCSTTVNCDGTWIFQCACSCFGPLSWIHTVLESTVPLSIINTFWRLCKYCQIICKCNNVKMQWNVLTVYMG